jgi:uncharacterized protein YkwD
LTAPRHVIARATGLAAATLVAAALLAGSPQIASGWNQSSAEGTLWQLMNGARINNGRAPVQSHSTLVALARWRSQDMVDRNYFSHDVLGTGYQVYHWYDTNGLRYSWGGENIGWNNGYADADSPVAIHEGFMNSPGHRANVLEPAFTHGGVGAYARDNVQFLGALRSPRFYTELFMVAASAAPPPPPPSGSNPPPPPAGGGGGSGGGTRPAAPAASSAPQANTLRVDAPAAPTPSQPLDGSTVLVAAPAAPSTAAVRASAWSDPATGQPATAAVTADAGMRIAAPAAADRGLFETVIGSFLGLFLG